MKKVLLGRPSNNVSMGIVGLPNVGKSLFFNLLCSMNVPSENFPFCTVRPGRGRATAAQESGCRRPRPPRGARVAIRARATR